MSKTARKLRKTHVLATAEPAPFFETVDLSVAANEANAKRLAGLEQRMTLLNYGIFVQALVAMLGSLYYSTFGDPVVNMAAGQLFPSSGGFVPCELCWFARILMYPIVVISGIALLKEDRRFTDYVLPMTLVGIFLEFFHYGLQMWNFPNPFRCTAANPCSALQVNYFGFITIPLLCLTAFVIITVLALVHVWMVRQVRRTQAIN